MQEQIVYDLNHDRNNFEIHKNVKSILMYGDRKNRDIFISFVIPTVDRIDMLKETVNSILSQRKEFEYEIIIVDNSTNLTDSNMTYRYVKQLNNANVLLYVNEKNIGQAGNWNRGFELARGKYISLIHDDDLLCNVYTTEIRKCITNAKKKKRKLGIIKVRYKNFHSIDDLKELSNNERGGIRKYRMIDSVVVDGIGPTSCPTCGIIFLKDAVIKVGGFDERFYPSFDYILGFKILKEGYAVYTTEDELGYYRISVNESMKGDNFKRFCIVDYCFREYMYSLSLWTSICGFMFRKVQYWDNLNNIHNYALEFGKEIPIEELECADIEKNSHITKLIYRIIKKIVVVTNKRVIK